MSFRTFDFSDISLVQQTMDLIRNEITRTESWFVVSEKKHVEAAAQKAMNNLLLVF